MRRLLRAVRLTVPVVVAAAAGVAVGLFGFVVIAGGSMAPTLSPGDVLVFKRAPVTVAARDVVVLSRPEWQRPVVHRVVSVTETGGLVTQGDANTIADATTLPPTAVSGRGVAILPVGRAVTRLAGVVRRARLLLQYQTAMR